MRSARALADELEELHDDFGPWAYGVFTGLAVSYARPFSQQNRYGALESKWTKFANRPELRARHKELIEHRNQLLAHNDLTPHRAMIIWPSGHFHEGQPVIVEARSPINATGAGESKELIRFQEQRFGEAAQQLACRLERDLDWTAHGEIDLDAELARVRGLGTE